MVNRTLVIAEPGCTAEGNYGDMVELIHRAKEADADVFKAQWTSDPVQMCERRHITKDHPKREYYLKAYSWLNFPVEWHAEFKAICDSLGIAYACTSFLPQDVATVDPFVSMHKIASFENQDPTMLHEVRRMGKHAVVSTGGCDWDTAFQLLDIADYDSRSGMNPDVPRWSVLHCISAYPAPIDAMNLGLLIEHDGLSDHSRDIDMGGFAVCAGARIVEAHFRLYSCSKDNPDYATAFDPGEFAMYVSKIRKAERALGDGVKRVQPSEEWALQYKVTA